MKIGQNQRHLVILYRIAGEASKEGRQTSTHLNALHIHHFAISNHFPLNL